jgi:uncharacterized protein YggE
MKNYNYQPLITVAGTLAIVFIFLFLVKFFDVAYPISVTHTNRDNQFSVTGDGKVDVVPDTAYVDAGITVDNLKTADEAQGKMTEVNNAIINAVKQLGIKKEDIKTSQYSVNPAYSYDNGQNKITGYNGDATVTIKVSDTKMAPQVIEAVTKAGATNVGAARFEIGDPSKYREEARNKAIENGKEQAQKLAKQLGIRLGSVTNVYENTDQGQPGPQPYAEGASLMKTNAAVQPTIEEGQQSVTSSVTLYFERL